MSDESTSNMGSSGQLCTRCEDILLGDDWPEFQGAYHHGNPHHVPTAPHERVISDFWGEDKFPDLPNLQKSSLQCTFCKFLRDIMRSDQAFTTFEYSYALSPHGSSHFMHYYLSFLWNSTIANEGIDQYLVLRVMFEDLAGSLYFYCTIRPSDESSELASWLGLNQPRHDKLTNKKTVDWMRSKLNNCTETHNCGSGLLKSEFLPERLLDVRENTPKLVYGADIRTCSQNTPMYSALSYCWGTKEDASHQLKFEKKSEQMFWTGIDERDLSAVHRDAIHVTRTLSIPYIWIDALCILQDDDNREDWKRQCEQMERIYGCAHVSLLASASSSCHNSFLRQTDSLQTIVPLRSVRQPSQMDSFLVELKAVTIRTMNNVENTLHHDLGNCRLATRGWAFQEKILSTRLFLFGNWNIHYLCSNSWQTLNGTKWNESYGTCADDIRQSLSTGNYYDAWGSIFPAAAVFGKRSFTYPQDILPALSGLARLIHNPNDKYLAGHWTQVLFRSLAWQRDLYTTTPKEAHFKEIFENDTYIVPSWSVLCKGPVESCVDAKNFFNIASEVRSCLGHVDLVGTDPFGAIEDARLEIRSHTFRNHDRVDQSISTIRQIKRHSPINSWSLVVDWDSRQHHCSVWLDYASQASDIIEDLRMMRWVLLGSLEIPMDDEPRAPSTTSNHSHPSQPEYQEVQRGSVSVVGNVDASQDDQESRSSNSDASIAPPSSQCEFPNLIGGEEGLASNHDGYGQLHELVLSNNQNEQDFAEAWGTDQAEHVYYDSDIEPERYPYGLLLFQFPNRQEWYRAGVFMPDVYECQQDRLSHPELELMTLDTFQEMSHIETITVL